MSIFNIQQLRDSAPAEFRDLPPEDLVREYSRSTGVPFEQAANFFGVAPRGTLAEMGRQAVGGLRVDLPRMIGQGLKATGIAPEYGQELVTAAEQRAYQYEPDVRGRGLVGQAGVLGARGLAPALSVAPLAFMPGGQLAAPAAAATLFGTSAYQETYEKLIGQGVPEEDARAAALRVGAVQGPLEGVATAVGLRSLRPALAAVRGAPTTARVAESATDTSILRPFLRGQAVNIPVQAGTEVAQDVGTELIERAYGATPEDIGQIARQSALGGAGLAGILAPLGLGGSVARARRAESLKQALYGEDTPEGTRAVARLQVAELARQQGVADADVDNWLQRQLREADASAKYLAAEEKAVASDIQKLAEQEPLYADIAYALRDPELAKVMSEQDRQILFGAAQALRAPDLAPEAQRLVLDEANGVIAAYLSQEGIEGIQDLTTGARPALFQAPRVSETQVGGLTQVSTNLPADLTAYQAPTGLGRQPAATQPVPGVPGVRQVAPGIFTAPEQLQQIETRQLAAPAAPVVSPPSGAPAVSPAAPAAAGGSLPATPAAPAAPAKPRVKKAAAAPAVATAPTKRTAPKPRRNAKTTPTTKAPVVELDTEATDQEAQQSQQAIDELGLKPLAEGGQKNLQASVRGGNIAVSGKVSIGARALTAARNAFLGVQKTERKPTSEGGKLAAAAKAFGEAYMKYLNTAGNMVPTERKDKAGNVLPLKPPRGSTARGDAAVAAERAGMSVGKVQAALRAAQDTLTALGEAAGNNAKNVEALIRVTKDEIGRRKAALQVELDAALEDPASDEEGIQDTVDEIARLGQLDQGLSAGWAAAKRGVFRLDVDKMDVRGGEVRTSKEEQREGAEQPLERAAKYGAAVGPRAKQETGFQGVLNYIRSRGTPFERMIAKGVTEVFRNTKNPPQLVFTDDGRSEYDPNTNTVFMSRTASPEVALHEALHAALQWYVHSNPKNPMVVQLLKAVDKVVKYDTNKLSEKAAAVQKVLADLKKGKRDLDAVLELISYGNTLVEFRKALEAMPTKGEPTSFVQAAKDVWNMILATVRRMLNVPQSVASDVIMDSFKLLEEASRAQYTPMGGAKLEAATQTNTAPAQQLQTLQEGLDKSRNALAEEAGFSNYSTYADRPSTSFNLTRLLFEQVGFGKGGRVDKALQAAAQNSANIIRKEFPALEFVILNLNSKFGQSPMFQRLADFFKQDAQTGLLEAEYVSQYIYRNPQDAEKIIRYLDGDQTALSDTGRDATLRRMGDNILRHISEYMTTLPAKDRRLFENMKFSDYVLNPQSIAQLAGKTVGIRALREKVATESRTETNIEDFKKFLTFKDGVLDTDVPMYQFFETIPDGKGSMIRVPQGFISKDKVEQNPGMDVDRSRVWYLDKPAKEDSNSFVFKTRAVVGENLRDISRKLASGTLEPVEREQAVQQISAALVNTIAALSHNYAATNLFSGLNSLGRDESGAPTARSIAFDDVNQINDTFKDRKITDANVLEVSSDEARAFSVRSEAQRSGVWVRLPNTDTYGVLKGKIIPGTVWNSLLDMNDRAPLLNSQTLSDIMTSFKKAKTVLTPATHVNNILTNYALMLLHGIPHKALQDAARLMYRYEVSPKALTKDQLRMMQEFYRSGAVLGQFTNTEAKKFITQRLADNIRPENDRTLLEKLGAWAGFERDTEQLLARAARAGKLTDNFFTEVYAAGDNVFRLAAFLNTAGNIQAAAGVDSLTDAQIREAGLAARKLFLDYDIDARWVRAARQSFLPFVSWAYAITPVLGRLAIEKPWTLVNMMAALGIMGAMLDGGDDEWRKKGPDQVRDMFLGVIPSYYRVPFMGDDENPVYYNLGKSIPFISLFQPAQGQAKLFGQDWFPSVLNPGGPYTSIISAVLFGTDAFTGKPLADATDTQLNKFLKGAESVYNTMTPSIASTRLWGPEEGEIAKLLQNRKGPTGVEPDALFIARTFGLSAYEFNRSETEYWQDGQIKKLKREFETVMNKAKRTEYAKGYPDYEALDEKLADLRERLEKRITEIRGEE